MLLACPSFHRFWQTQNWRQISQLQAVARLFSLSFTNPKYASLKIMFYGELATFCCLTGSFLCVTESRLEIVSVFRFCFQSLSPQFSIDWVNLCCRSLTVVPQSLHCKRGDFCGAEVFQTDVWVWLFLVLPSPSCYSASGLHPTSCFWIA